MKRTRIISKCIWKCAKYFGIQKLMNILVNQKLIKKLEQCSNFSLEMSFTSKQDHPYNMQQQHLFVTRIVVTFVVSDNFPLHWSKQKSRNFNFCFAQKAVDVFRKIATCPKIFLIIRPWKKQVSRMRSISFDALTKSGKIYLSWKLQELFHERAAEPRELVWTSPNEQSSVGPALHTVQKVLCADLESALLQLQGRLTAEALVV